jgi:hypothetical protein
MLRRWRSTGDRSSLTVLWRSAPPISLRRADWASPAVVGYTGVRLSGRDSPALTGLTRGWIISAPKKPSRTSPKMRSRAPTASCFCWLG